MNKERMKLSDMDVDEYAASDKYRAWKPALSELK